MNTTSAISPSSEDYLEAIYFLGGEQKGVRVTDISSQLGVKKPSVNKAMSLLREDGYLTQEKYGDIFLTPKGLEAAKKVSVKHHILFDLLHKKLGIPAEKAENEACKIEHLLSDETIAKLKMLLD